jgi:hypothetical protein
MKRVARHAPRASSAPLGPRIVYPPLPVARAVAGSHSPRPVRLILDPLRAFAKGRPFEWYLTPVGSFGSPSSS